MVLTIVGILLVSYVLFYVGYNSIKYIISNPIKHVGSQEQIDLSKISQVISSEELKNAWAMTQGSTLLFFIFPEIKDRTSISGNEYTNVITG